MATSLSALISLAPAHETTESCALLPYHDCGAGALLCRCTSNVFSDLTSVTLAPGSPEYIDARLLELAPQLINDWRPGDILFVGDSLTDFGRLDFDPLLPRSFNAAVLGAKTADVSHTLDLFEMFFSAPSKVVVLVGSNNLRPTPDAGPKFTTAEFQPLMERLKVFKDLHGTQIYVRSIPPAEPDATAMWNPELYHLIYRTCVAQANTYLRRTCADPAYGFTFVDDYQFFWNPDEGHINTNLYVGPRYTPCLPEDYLHIGCNGYMLSLANLTASLYQPLPGQAGQFPLAGEPTAPPKSNHQLQTAGNNYHYVQVTILPGEVARLAVLDSPYTYAALYDPYVTIFTPTFTYGLPSVEMERTDGDTATISFRNTLPIPQTVALCLGTSAATPGAWTYTSGPEF